MAGGLGAVYMTWFLLVYLSLFPARASRNIVSPIFLAYNFASSLSFVIFNLFFLASLFFIFTRERKACTCYEVIKSDEFGVVSVFEQFNNKSLDADTPRIGVTLGMFV